MAQAMEVDKGGDSKATGEEVEDRGDDDTSKCNSREETAEGETLVGKLFLSGIERQPSK